MEHNKPHANLTNYGVIGVSFVAYIVLFVMTRERWEHGAGFFVLIPLVAVALIFGLKGGILLGMLVHPLNLALRYVLGEPITSKYFQANYLVIWGFAVMLGIFIGYLRDLNARFRQIAGESSQLTKFPSENPNPVLRVDRDGTILYANSASAPLLETWQVQVGQCIPEDWCTLVTSVLDTRHTEEREVTCHQCVVALTLAPVADMDYVNIYGLNVTERKQAELDRAQLARFPGENPNPVLRITNDCIIFYANLASTLLLETWQTQVEQRLPDKWCAFAREVLDTGQSQEREVLCHDHILSLTFAPVTDADYINVYGLDITARKQTEQALRDAKQIAEEHAREAEAANQAKSVFLANISHELRTPLNAILGFSELMMHDSNLTSVQRNNMKTIGRSGGHLLALINDVLELSKIETGRIELNLVQFDLDKMLSGLDEIFQLPTKKKDIELIFNCDHNVPQYIRADEQKLYQVLVNLLGNAVKFTEDGSITLRVSECSKPYETEREHAVLHFEVEDTGLGISSEELDAVFDTFVQTESGRRSKQGTGLGIPISRRYVRMMGGDLTVKSEFSKGSCFKFDIEVEITDASQMDMVLPSRRVVGIVPESKFADDGPYRMLIAEDVDANRALLMTLLQPFGFKLQEAVNGQQALEIWQTWQPHLIWMDIRMPVLDGKQAIKHIRATPQEQDTIIIAVTASAFVGDRTELMAMGCDDFVRKPFRETQIFEVLTKHLGIEFVYEEQSSAQLGAVTRGQKKSMSLNLDGVSPVWASELHQAALEGDIEWMRELVEQIKAQHPVLAQTLMKMIYNFEHEAILAITESY